MTKQSNFFQRVVAAVERALAADGVHVTESAMVAEAASGTEREIDVLIDGSVNNYPVRIALECRDHSTPQDVTWIDALAGKYAGGGVALIVAVSSSGFTKAAQTKAEALGIRAIHFKEADADAFPDLRIILVRITNRLTGVQFRVEPPFASASEWKSGYDTPLFDASGFQNGTLRSFVESLFQTDMQEAIKPHGSTTAEAITTGAPVAPIVVRQPYTGRGLFFHAPSGSRHELVEVIPEATLEFTPATGSVKAFEYNRSRVIVGTAPLGNGQMIGMAGVVDESTKSGSLCHVEIASTGSLRLRGMDLDAGGA